MPHDKRLFGTMAQGEGVAPQGVATSHGYWRRLGYDLAYGYRLRSDRTLVSGQRALLVTLFGYTIGTQGPMGLLVVNTAVIALLFMFFGAYDNWCDWRLLGEENGTRAVIEQRRLSQVQGFALVFAPWLAILPLVFLARTWGMSAWSEAILWLMTLLGLTYMTPGIRLKERPLSFFVAPLWACLLFLQAYLLTGYGRWDVSAVFLCLAVFAVQCQAEILHRLDNHLHHSGVPRQAVTQQLLTWLRWPSYGVFVGSLAAALINPLFLNTSVWSVVRVWSMTRLRVDDISKLRRQLWHPVWSLYEFAIYAVVGVSLRPF